jgi:F-type H+-transporting ATPase subunit c
MVFFMSFRKALMFTITALTFGASMAVAQEHGGGEGALNTYGPLASALAIGLAAFGGALGQGRTAAAALEGIARNPAASGKILTPMIIGLALIESLVLYALLIAFVKIKG